MMGAIMRRYRSRCASDITGSNAMQNSVLGASASSAQGAYEFRILQAGTLPLRPDGSVAGTTEHRCTSVLIWPAAERPSRSNTICTDPCFTDEGFRQIAAPALRELGLSVSDLSYCFVTHEHGDHRPWFPTEQPDNLRPLPAAPNKAGFPGLSTVRCPGHSPRLQVLRFRSTQSQDVWTVGDAVLNLEWLQAWGYYWPNSYDVAAIVKTWHSVATILEADIIIPGHGEPISVTADLMRQLLTSFGDAEFSSECPEVKKRLELRLHDLESRDRPALGRVQNTPQ
jgi:glyoxylase-like metal-dependent hydrolase (beta-lactamase superfamily II)